MVQNKSVVFKKIPDGFPVPGEHVVVESNEFDLDQKLEPGSVILKTVYTSFDPYMRGRMRDPSKKSYSPALPLNQAINSSSIATVEKSANDAFKPGDNVYGYIPIENYTLLTADSIKNTGLRKVENPYNLDLHLFVGALGMPGLTAYSSFYEIGKPKKGETIFISAAAGAVGQIVGQLAKHEGLKVIGSVGDDKKLEFITKELKFDGGFNYKKESASDALKRLAPDGIDIYYENVGGDQLEAALFASKDFGRVVVCGLISQYNKKEEQPIKGFTQILSKRLTVRGFIVGDANMGPLYKEEFDKNVAKWLADGSFIAKVHVTEGIDNGPKGLVDIFHGKNFGKAVLKL